ncbi:hypothetical protein Tco_0177469, partial [Tanacetum coccineum]
MKILRLLTLLKHTISLLHLRQTSLNLFMLYLLKLQTLTPPVMTFSRNMTTLTKRQLVKYLRKVLTVLFDRITEDNWEKHEEATINYTNLKASIDEYYDENISHRDQTDKLVKASMSSHDKSRTTMDDLYKGLNVITALLKDINNAVKDDH